MEAYAVLGEDLKKGQLTAVVLSWRVTEYQGSYPIPEVVHNPNQLEAKCFDEVRIDLDPPTWFVKEVLSATAPYYFTPCPEQTPEVIQTTPDGPLIASAQESSPGIEKLVEEGAISKARENAQRLLDGGLRASEFISDPDVSREFDLLPWRELMKNHDERAEQFVREAFKERLVTFPQDSVIIFRYPSSHPNVDKLREAVSKICRETGRNCVLIPDDLEEFVGDLASLRELRDTINERIYDLERNR